MMAAQLDAALHDAVLQHAVRLTRVEAGVNARVLRRLRVLRADLGALIREPLPRTLAEQRKLFAQANELIAQAIAKIEEADVRPALQAVGETQAQAIVGALEAENA